MICELYLKKRCCFENFKKDKHCEFFKKNRHVQLLLTMWMNPTYIMLSEWRRIKEYVSMVHVVLLR